MSLLLRGHIFVDVSARNPKDADIDEEQVTASFIFMNEAGPMFYFKLLPFLLSLLFMSLLINFLLTRIPHVH